MGLGDVLIVTIAFDVLTLLAILGVKGELRRIADALEGKQKK